MHIPENNNNNADFTFSYTGSLEYVGQRITAVFQVQKVNRGHMPRLCIVAFYISNSDQYIQYFIYMGAQSPFWLTYFLLLQQIYYIQVPTVSSNLQKILHIWLESVINCSPVTHLGSIWYNKDSAFLFSSRNAVVRSSTKPSRLFAYCSIRSRSVSKKFLCDVILWVY